MRVTEMMSSSDANTYANYLLPYHVHEFSGQSFARGSVESSEVGHDDGWKQGADLILDKIRIASFEDNYVIIDKWLLTLHK